MFTNLIETYSTKTSYQQKEALVRQFINEIKKSDLSSVNEALQYQFQAVFNILKQHPQPTVEMIFQKITVQNCLFLMKNTSIKHPELNEHSILRLLDQIGTNLEQNKDIRFIEWFSKTYTKYSNLQKQLIQNYLPKFQEEFLPEFLADFIKSSRLVVEIYLKLKAQAPKFDYDYIEHGEQIVKSTENWLKNLYIKTLKKLIVPEKQDLKIAILNGVCDIIGAVMEIQRQGAIEKTVCQGILVQSFNYTKKLTTIDEFNKIYLNRLKQQSFNIQNRKIIIPERYPSNSITFPKQAFSFIVFNFLKQSLELYSDQKIVNYLIPVINQLSQFEYEIKSQIQDIFVQKITTNPLLFKTCFQSQFPVCLLYFNLWNNQQKRNKVLLTALDKVYQLLRKVNFVTLVNNLKILAHFYIKDLENEKNHFIGLKSLEVCEQRPQLLIGLIKNMRWENMNEKGEKTWKNVMNSLRNKTQTKYQVERILRRRNDRNKFQNEVLKIMSEQ